MSASPDLFESGTIERRRESRLRYSWQMYFQPHDGRIEQGRMVDLSSSGACFLTKNACDLRPGHRLPLRLTHPMIQDDLFTIIEVRREAEVLRVEPHACDQQRVAVRLDPPLDYAPAEASDNEGSLFLME